MVEQGDDAASIAWAYGFHDWETVWNHASNAELRAAHDSPRVLAPGSTVFVPENTSMRFELATDATHRVVVEVPRTTLRVHFKLGNAPLANLEYVLAYDVLGGRHEVRDQRTDADGLMVAEGIPMHVRVVDVVFPTRLLRYRLRVGALDPLQRGADAIVTGVQARLNNLGYGCGAVDGRPGPRTRAAIRLFQREILERDDASGELDQETLDAISREYGR